VKTRRWDFVSDHAKAFGVQRICRVLQVSRCGYYRWLAGAKAREERQAAEDELVAEIREIHTAHKGTYGVRRVHAELRGFGHTVNRKRIERLMRLNRIEGRHLRRRKHTTVPDRFAPPAPDLVQRDFSAGHLDERRCGDIAYVQVGGSWLYPACVIGICSRRVIGWSMASHMRTELVIDALNMTQEGGDAREAVLDDASGETGDLPVAHLLQRSQAIQRHQLPLAYRVRTAPPERT
jgi:transposase InsO family protein